MGDNPCSARSSFTFAGNRESYLLAVMAYGSTFLGVFLKFFNKLNNLFFERWEFFHQAFVLAFKNGYYFDP